MPLTFNMLLRAEGVDPNTVRLLRHETRRHGLTPYALWRDNRDEFDRYQQIQKRDRRAWFDSPLWAAFVVAPDGKTLFAGLSAVSSGNKIPEGWIDPISARTTATLEDYELYQLERLLMLKDYIGRLAIDWGVGTRSWAQRADRREKPIVELREALIEPTFPGYATFVAQLSTLETLPMDWRAALSAAKGLYLLTCPRTLEQYVGSATGIDGFLGRWRGYVRDGHGGNVVLRSREPSDYRVSILQVAGSGDSLDDVLAMEALWKAKLQSRDMSLNAN